MMSKMVANRLGRAKLPLLAAAALGSLTACVQVSAPDKPIVVNLNIRIQQEVVVRLAEDVRDLKRREPGVF